MPFFDEPAEAETPEQVIQRAVRRERPERVGGRKRDRRVAADGRESEGFAGALFALGQLFALAGLDGRVVEIFVHAVERAEAAQQLEGCLLADAGHAGDVVGRVAHQRFEVDHFERVEAVLLPEQGGVVLGRLGLAHPGFDEYDVAIVRDELEGVAVAGHEEGLIALLLADAGHGAEEVVGLPAGQLIAADAHRVQRLLEKRHLYAQLLGHGLSRGLVRVAQLMAERRGVYVERDAYAVGLPLVEKPLQDLQKAVYGVRRRAVRRGQHTDAVKCAVYDGVAVEDHDCPVHASASFRLSERLSYR